CSSLLSALGIVGEEEVAYEESCGPHGAGAKGYAARKLLGALALSLIRGEGYIGVQHLERSVVNRTSDRWCALGPRVPLGLSRSIWLAEEMENPAGYLHTHFYV